MIAKVIVTLALLAATCSAGVVPVAPAAAYVNTVPYNVPPYASSVNIVNRGLASPYVAAPYVASPYVASPYVASPYVAAPYTAAAVAGYPFSYPYAAAAPYVAAPLLK